MRAEHLAVARSCCQHDRLRDGTLVSICSGGGLCQEHNLSLFTTLSLLPEELCAPQNVTAAIAQQDTQKDEQNTKRTNHQDKKANIKYQISNIKYQISNL